VNSDYQHSKADADCADFADERGKNTLLYGDTTRVILGAFLAVHCELGAGFLEAVYANALTVLLHHGGLKVERQVPFEIVFHGQRIGRYRADLVVESIIVVEIKAFHSIVSQHSIQLLNYLKASGLQVGLLLNFGAKAEFKRVVCTRNPPR
jgi:GxxExxY protein